MKKWILWVVVAIFVLIGVFIVLFFLNQDGKPNALKVLFISDHPFNSQSSYPSELSIFFHVFEAGENDYYPEFDIQRLDSSNNPTQIFRLSSGENGDLNNTPQEMGKIYSALSKTAPVSEVYQKKGSSLGDLAQDTIGVRTFILSKGNANVDNIKTFSSIQTLHDTMEAKSAKGTLIGPNQRPDAVVILFLSGTGGQVGGRRSKEDRDGDGFIISEDCDDNDPNKHEGAPCDDHDPKTKEDRFDWSCRCKGFLDEEPPPRVLKIPIKRTMENQTTVFSWDKIEGAEKYVVHLKPSSKNDDPNGVCSYDQTQVFNSNGPLVFEVTEKGIKSSCYMELEITAYDADDHEIGKGRLSEFNINCNRK